MSYHFRNLVFEGGGVKGIAYVGAMQELEKRGILSDIQRVAGASAGAVYAVLAGLGYTTEETKRILWDMDFNKFMDSSAGFIRNSIRLFRSFGWFKGDFCQNWIGELVKAKTGDACCTFAAAEEMRSARGFKSMHFMTTNLNTRTSEVFSAEKTPDVPIAYAVRLSMSIPFFFAARWHGPRQDVYVDGGVLDNYPVKIFDRVRYVTTANGARDTEYYGAINKELLRKHPRSSPHTYNKETLGFRLDSKDKISLFRDQQEPVAHEVSNLFNFIKNIAFTYLDAQDNKHLHSDDWQRTIYIDTLGVRTTDFALTDAVKDKLVESGLTWTKKYFDWYDNSGEPIANK